MKTCEYLCSIFLCFLIFLNCSTKPSELEIVKLYPVDNLDGIISLSKVSIDSVERQEGYGSLKIVTSEPQVVNLFESGDIEVENARLIYQAKLRTRGVQGVVFLEMWCHFPGQGEFFSRGLQTQLSGDNEWNSQETLFFLRKGENPDNVKLNVVINGSGMVWIDDIRLLKAPR